MSTCYTSISLCNLRIAKLLASGAPKTGAGNGYNTNAPIKLDISVEVSTGDDKELKNGCGLVMATFKEPDKIKRLNLSMDLSQLDMDVISFLDGSDTFSSGAEVIGMQFPSVTSELTTVTCVEAWSKAWDGGQQAVDPFTTPDVTYFHWVFPLTKWVQGDKTIEDELMVVPMNGTSEENSHITANGPFNDWPAEIAGPGGITRIGGVFLDDSIPTAGCTPIAVTSAAS